MMETSQPLRGPNKPKTSFMRRSRVLQAGYNKDLEAAEEKALELRLKGWTCKDVAAELECSAAHVLRLYQRAMDRRRPLLDRKYQQWIDQQILQIEALYKKAEAMIGIPKDGPKYAEICVRLLERQAKLLGLDKPAQVEIIPPRPPSESDIDITKLTLAQLKQLRELRAASDAAEARTLEGTATVIEQPALAAPDPVRLDAHNESE